MKNLILITALLLTAICSAHDLERQGTITRVNDLEGNFLSADLTYKIKEGTSTITNMKVTITFDEIVEVDDVKAPDDPTPEEITAVADGKAKGLFQIYEDEFAKHEQKSLQEKTDVLQNQMTEIKITTEKVQTTK